MDDTEPRAPQAPRYELMRTGVRQWEIWRADRIAVLEDRAHAEQWIKLFKERRAP